MKTFAKATDTIVELIALYLTVIMASALAFAVLEHKGLADSIWWAVVTATTTGYGDFFPVTTAGRLVAVVLMHLSLLVILPLIIIRFTASVIEDQHRFEDAEQKRMFELLDRIEAAASARPWVIANSERDRFRGYDSMGPIWVQSVDDALKFYDRPSAERFCAEDEDAWRVFQPEV